jgi:hypothetical protein
VTIVDAQRIVAIEKDTSLMWYQCDCSYNLTTDITGLQPGTYTIDVYRHFEAITDVYYMGSTSCVVGGGGALPQGFAIQKIDTHENVLPSQGNNTSLVTGWNLISVPLMVSDFQASSVFSNKAGDMYTYDPQAMNYIPASLLIGGRGYWLNNTTTGTKYFYGYPVSGLSATVQQAGWILVGSTSTPMNISSLVLSDGAIIAGSAYKFNPASGGYDPTTVINPGEAAWVNVTKACTISIP